MPRLVQSMRGYAILVGRNTFAAVIKKALAGFHLLSESEGIIPALESAHAIGKLGRGRGWIRTGGSLIVVNVSGRGDKDVAEVARYEGVDLSDAQSAMPSATDVVRRSSAGR